MEPRIVFLDTEPLMRDPGRRSAPFEALTHLAERGVVRIHISELSISEFVSRLQGSEAQVVGKLSDALATLERSSRREAVHEQCRQLLEDSSALAAELRAEAAAALYLWIESASVVVHPIADHHAGDVFRAYFSGAIPFSDKKKRADIPDAFIWQGVAELAASGEVLFVSGDRDFREAAGSHASVRSFPSISELLKLSELSEALREGALESQLQLLREILEPWVRSEKRVTSLVSEAIVGRRVFFFFPVEGDYDVSEVISLDRIVDEGQPTYYGEGLVVIPFSGRATCRVLGPSRKSTAEEQLSTAERIQLERVLVFSGALRVAVPAKVLGEPLPNERLIEALDGAEIALESLSLYQEAGGQNLAAELFQKHAFEEARRQIKEGDLDVAVDPAEEADRIARARWRPVPPHLVGEHGDLTIGQDARFHIAPMPRFEHWVRFLKREMLKPGEPSAGGKRE
jgi:hypothetical protein